MTKKQLSDFSQDNRNANRGTPRGQKTIVESIQRSGVGRSIVTDKFGVVIGGNKSIEAMAEVLGGVEPIVIESDGTRPIIHRRTNLDLSDPDPNNPARAMAYADNRSGQLSLEWDAETIIEDIESGLDLSFLFGDNEIEEFREELDLAAELALSLLDEPNERNLGDKKKQIKPVLYADELETFEAAILETGEVNRGKAIIEICEYFLSAKRQFDV